MTGCWVYRWLLPPNWRQKEKRETEDEMVAWHHRLIGYEFEQTLGDSGGQGSLACSVHGVTRSQTWLSDWMTTGRQRKTISPASPPALTAAAQGPLGFSCWVPVISVNTKHINNMAFLSSSRELILFIIREGSSLEYELESLEMGQWGGI